MAYDGTMLLFLNNAPINVNTLPPQYGIGGAKKIPGGISLTLLNYNHL